MGVRGSKASNHRSGTLLGELLVGYLTGRGIAAVRIHAASWGDTRPDLPNDTETNRSRNRQIAFKIKQD